jgi:hypothetical protein
MTRLALFFGAAALLAGGCGGEEGIDEGPDAQEGRAEPLLMRATVTQADGLRTALAAQNGDAIAGAAVSLSVGAMNAVRPAIGAQPLSISQQMQVLAQTTPGGATSGSKSCTATGCTFTSFGNGQFTISGSVSSTEVAGGAKRVLWSLTGTTTAAAIPTSGQVQGLDFSYSWKGDLTVSPTSIAGAAGSTWSGGGQTQGQSFDFNYGSVVKFQGVTVENGCPTAGGVFAKWWISVEAAGQSQTQAYQATHRFNGCTR